MAFRVTGAFMGLVPLPGLERAEAIRGRDLALRRETTLRYLLDEATANLSSSQQKARMLEKERDQRRFSGV